MIKFKRFLSTLLALLMVIGLIPLSSITVSAATTISLNRPLDKAYTITAREYYSSGSYHGAIDYGCPKGTPVYAAESGTISVYDDGYGDGYYGSTDGSGWGNYADISHGNGWYTRYAHMSTGRFVVSSGSYVQRGQLIGYSGNSGNSTGAHLHFGLYLNGLKSANKVYPESYITTSTGYFNGTTHTVDSSYSTNISAYPKAKITAANIFDENHNQISSGAWIGTSDQCTIHEVYTDGCCKVTYPLDNGGTKTVYSKISLFNVSSPRVRYWISDTEYGDTPSEYKAGNRYYFCYKFYDAISGKNWDEIENCDYTFNLTFYNPDGSVKYTNERVLDYDQSWISSIFSEPGTYTAKLVMSGDYTLEGTRTFTVQENPKQIHSSTNLISLNLSGTKSQTIYLWSSGYYSGNAVWNWSSSNSNISCSWGEWTDDSRLPLTITANSVGSTTLTITLKDKDSGVLLDSANISVVVNVNTSALSVNSSNSAVISTGGEMKYFTYTPSTSGKYVIYSTGSEDTKVYLYNSNWTELDSDDDDGDGNNFRLEYNLTAGTTYKFAIKYYNSSKTGTISFKFGNVYTVTYNANGGSGAPSSQTKYYGIDLELSKAQPSRTGYNFVKWNTYSDGSGKSYYSGDYYSLNESDTLYAIWNPNRYTVKYNSNGGNGTMSSTSHVYDTASTLRANSFTKDGYRFLGWSTDPSAKSPTYSNSQSVKNLTSKNDAIIILYAVWEDNSKPYAKLVSTNDTSTSQTVTVHFSDNDGIAGYYWGTSSSYTANSYTATNTTTVYKTITSEGTYYLTVKDRSGNLSATYDIGFSRIDLKGNGVSVTPGYIIAENYSNISLPVLTRNGYEFKGWASSVTDNQGILDLYVTENDVYIALWEEDIYPVSMQISKGPSKTDYYIGDTVDVSDVQLGVTYSDGSVKTIKNISSDANVKLDDTKLESVGENIVIVRYNGFKDTFTVNVKSPAIALSDYELSMSMGEQTEIKVTTDPEDVTIKADSSDKRIATIENGIIKAVGVGETDITIRFTYNGLTYKKICKVRVSELKPVSVDIVNAPDKTVYYIGDSINTNGLKLKLTYDNGSTKTVTEGFELKNSNLKTEGDKTITVIYQGLSNTFTVNVKSPVIALSDYELSMSAGEQTEIKVTTDPEDVIVKADSSDKRIATIENGVVKAVSIGKADIIIRFTYNGLTYKKICKVVVKEKENPGFADVKPSSWYAAGVNYCAEKGYITGVGNNKFNPDGKLTREQFVVILARVAGADLTGYTSTDFTDVKVDSWYGPSVIWANESGYVNGIGNGKFGVGKNIDRESLATLFYRYAEKQGRDISTKADMSGYSDINSISSWSKDACAWAVGTGLLSSTNTKVLTLSPKMTVTRAQAAKIFMSYDNIK